MGQKAPTICRMQEVAFEQNPDGEWQQMDDEWGETTACRPALVLLAVKNPSQDQGNMCEQAAQTCQDAEASSSFMGCTPCCRAPVEAQIDEVLVVHHEALQKVGFLLRHDELQLCESPAVPECVTAMRRNRIQRRLAARQQKQAGWQQGGATSQTVQLGDSPSNSPFRCEMGYDIAEPSLSRGSNLSDISRLTRGDYAIDDLQPMDELPPFPPDADEINAIRMMDLMEYDSGEEALSAPAQATGSRDQSTNEGNHHSSEMDPV